MSDPAKYRTRDEVDNIREHSDPLKRCESYIYDGKHATEEELKAIDKEIKKVVKESADFALESPEPAPEELYTDIFA